MPTPEPSFPHLPFPLLPLFEKIQGHAPNKVALLDGDERVSYQELWRNSGCMARRLLGKRSSLAGMRVAFQLPAGSGYVATMWGIWRAGGVAVPLSLSATDAELHHALSDSGAEQIVCDSDSKRRFESITEQDLEKPSVCVLQSAMDGANTVDVEDALPVVEPHDPAMMLYTSGTTNKPKGVLSTHDNIAAQIESLVHAWQWQESDTIPLFLPLHHIHGIINILSCALWSGATVECFPAFDAPRILERVAGHRYTVFMAVPTIYVKLIERIQSMDQPQSQQVTQGFSAMRLMVSGSAALPARVHNQWESLTGQKLLERYGMTEIGMALSNPFEGQRRPGSVGIPLPKVQVRLKSEDGHIIENENESGEIQVRGPAVFREYWNQPNTTKESFDDGWFKTGDIAIVEDGYYRIMGRQSVDIIKSGGYKLSALEIESVLLEHDAIAQCAVVGLQDDTWGEAVAAMVVLHPQQNLTTEELRDWCSSRMSHYKIPKRVLIGEELPRNAMGKVTKPAVVKRFQDSTS